MIWQYFISGRLDPKGFSLRGTSRNTTSLEWSGKMCLPNLYLKAYLQLNWYFVNMAVVVLKSAAYHPTGDLYDPIWISEQLHLHVKARNSKQWIWFWNTKPCLESLQQNDPRIALIISTFLIEWPIIIFYLYLPQLNIEQFKWSFKSSNPYHLVMRH